MTVEERVAARRAALERVAASHRPLDQIFADLREAASARRRFVGPPTEGPGAARERSGTATTPQPHVPSPLEQSMLGTLVAVAERASGAHRAGEVSRPDPEDIALWFTVEAEAALADLAAGGARRLAEERHLGVVQSVGDSAVDAAPPALHDLAEVVADAVEEASLDGLLTGFDTIAADLVPAAAARLQAVAGNAGYAAAARATGLSPRQRFGEPFCPAAECFGNNGRLIDDSVVESVGLPPYAADCNCTVSTD